MDEFGEINCTDCRKTTKDRGKDCNKFVVIVVSIDHNTNLNQSMANLSAVPSKPGQLQNKGMEALGTRLTCCWFRFDFVGNDCDGFP